MKYRKSEQNVLLNNWKLKYSYFVYMRPQTPPYHITKKLKPLLTASPRSGETGSLRLENSPFILPKLTTRARDSGQRKSL